MKRLMVTMLFAPAAALAHPSLVPHEHPHGPSLLPDLASMALAALVVGVIWLIARRAWRE